MKNGSKNYPVHFTKSDTSGEKAFEEFYTDLEKTDLERLKSLGVVIQKPLPDKNRIQNLVGQLNAAFQKPETTKQEIVTILKEYLPNFEHIETGKSLDGKM